jgi:phosphoribosylaminoimidazole-succinocarboxamide synthase
MDRSILIASKIESSYDTHAQITGSNVSLPNKRSGKVRDQYLLNSNTIALVTTDRQSGFDRMLALVPFKGQVGVFID